VTSAKIAVNLHKMKFVQLSRSCDDNDDDDDDDDNVESTKVSCGWE